MGILYTFFMMKLDGTFLPMINHCFLVEIWIAYVFFKNFVWFLVYPRICLFNYR